MWGKKTKIIIDALVLGKSLKMMDIEIFISLALGVPKNGHLNTLKLGSLPADQKYRTGRIIVQ